MSLSSARWAGTRGPSAWRRGPGSSGVLPWRVTGRPPCRRRAWAAGRGRLARAGRGGRPGLRAGGEPGLRGGVGWLGLAVGSGPGGFGGLEHAVGQLVVGLSVVEAGLAGGAGLVGAVGAHLGAVAHVVGGDIQRDQHGLPLAGRDHDRVTAVRAGRLRCRRRERCRVNGGTERMVLRALVDTGQVADEKDSPAGVLVIAAGEPVPVQYVQDVVVQVQSYPVVPHAPFLPWWWRAGGVDVGCDAGAGGGPPAAAGEVAGDIELVVVQGGGGAPVPGAGAAAGLGGGGAFGAGSFGGAFVPPGVVQGGDGVAQLRADR